MGRKKRKYKFRFGTFNCHDLCMTIKSKIFYKLGENYNWTNSKNNYWSCLEKEIVFLKSQLLLDFPIDLTPSRSKLGVIFD